MRWRLVTWVVLSGCVHTPPPPPPEPVPPPPPAIDIPRGCEADLSGELRQANAPQARWTATDDLDAGRLELLTSIELRRDAGPTPRRFSRDGGLAWLVKGTDGGLPIDAPLPMTITLARTELRRTSTGFHGTTVRDHDAGCSFSTSIVSCGVDGLVLETEFAKGAGCRERPDAGLERLVLIRPNAGSADAGPIDAGSDGVTDGG